MSPKLNAVAHEALELSPEERMMLAGRLLASVEPNAAAAWESNIAERIARYDAGESDPILRNNRRGAPLRLPLVGDDGVT